MEMSSSHVADSVVRCIRDNSREVLCLDALDLDPLGDFYPVPSKLPIGRLCGSKPALSCMEILLGPPHLNSTCDGLA
jgi:hypothetical protein